MGNRVHWKSDGTSFMKCLVLLYVLQCSRSKNIYWKRGQLWSGIKWRICRHPWLKFAQFKTAEKLYLCVTIPVVHSHWTAQGTSIAHWLCLHRWTTEWKKVTLNNEPQLLFHSLLLSEAASANHPQGKGSSRFDYLHPRGMVCPWCHAAIHLSGGLLYGPLIYVIWDTFNGKSIQHINSLLVSEGDPRLRGDWGPNAMQWGPGHCTGETLRFSPLEAVQISPLETSLG